MFMSWPEGRVLLAVLPLITRWGTALAWCCGFFGFVCGVLFSFFFFWTKHCSQNLQPLLSHRLETHALSVVCFNSCVEGICGRGHVKTGQEQRTENREEPELLTVYWTTACINQKWHCWATVCSWRCVLGKSNCGAAVHPAENSCSKSRKPNQLTIL